MTELEFEKAARGPSSAGTPVLAAYVWNSTTILAANAGALSNAGQDAEVSTSTGDGLCAYNSGNTTHGPLRTGFAATGVSSRAGAGASFYGILDLSGNVWEQAYHVGYNGGSGNGAAPSFTGVLGDGTLDAVGFADALNWGGQSGVVRSVVRGGNWNNINSYCQISNRSFITSGGGENGTRIARTGGRGVRQF
jgi:formylglycine-generating enzyme required for sulfatase activity